MLWTYSRSSLDTASKSLVLGKFGVTEQRERARSRQR